MDYLVQNGSEILKLTVVSGVPQLPEGMTLIGLESEINPDGHDLAVSTLAEVELVAQHQVLVKAAVEAQVEVLEQTEVVVNGVVTVPYIAHQDAVVYEAPIYNTVLALTGMRMVADSVKATAKTTADTKAHIISVIEAAKKFGNEISNEFSAENVLLGISADNMTGTVLNALAGVLVACTAGSLKEAITRTKALPSESKDAKYVTDARLLAFVNKIETYLQIPLSTTL